MAWGARQHDDGTWRLCQRRGKTILHANEKRFPSIQIRFDGRAAAQKCAEVLNKAYWSDYERIDRKANQNGWPRESLVRPMLLVIVEHGGLSQADADAILNS